MNSQKTVENISLSATPEVKPRRGRLKVFLGMCAGVGKTYAMLQAAHREIADGVDVHAGVVETHGRKETEALLSGLTLIPKRKWTHRGVQIEEMDLDAILECHPQLVLVDELAHTNAPGSRHPKRYQDVEELLEAGISVHATLNVQHIESRADVVRQITGVTVQETVPDSILDQASEIQMMDLSPDELRERLEEGKVYIGDRAQVASANFFKTENLNALREMTLRLAAEHADKSLRDSMKNRGISGPWKAGERLLVGVGPSPFSESLIRWTRRVAGALEGSWIAVCVETDEPLGDEEKERLTRNLSLARQLGAEVLMTSGQDVADTLLRVSRENNVTQIVVGKTHESAWKNFLHGGSLVQRLIHHSGLIDVYVVQPEKDASKSKETPRRWSPSPYHEFFTAGGITVLLTLLFLGVAELIGYSSIALLFLLWVVIAGLRFRRRTVFLVALLSALLWDFLFIPPRGTFYIGSFTDAMMFCMFFVVAIAIGQLTARLRANELAQRQRERRTAALYELARQAALTPELHEGLEAAARLIESLLPIQVAMLLRQKDHRLSETTHACSSWALSEKERSVAEWTFSKSVPAGRMTNTLPDAEGFYMPLQARTAVMGVLAVRLKNGQILDLSERELLGAFAGLIAAILEKDHFIEAFKNAEIIQASEHLRNALLDSVSHELKTPLSTLQGFVSKLESLAFPGKEHTLPEIQTALKRLHRVINNLLDMTRIQSGAVQPKLDWCDVEELIHSALELTGDVLDSHPLTLEIFPDLPMLKLDQALLEQSLSNLLMNAANWSQDKSPITVRASFQNGELTLSVLDEGPGIPPADLKRVFEKFYRAKDAPAGGTGLGLSIVQGFVHAHHGTVSAENRPSGGAMFTISITTESMHPPDLDLIQKFGK